VAGPGFPRKRFVAVGRRLDHWVVIEIGRSERHNRWMAKCMCERGAIREFRFDDLLRASTRSRACMACYHASKIGKINDRRNALIATAARQAIQRQEKMRRRRRTRYTVLEQQ